MVMFNGDVLTHSIEEEEDEPEEISLSVLLEKIGRARIAECLNAKTDVVQHFR